jgi:uncharacterized membrane protein
VKNICVVTALLIVGIVLRLPLLSNGLWRDEGYTYFEISAPSLHEMFGRIRLTETNPPLFYLLLRAWSHIFGFGELALKIFPMIWSTAALLVTYRLARVCASRGTALAALFLVATSYRAIWFSTEVRPYAMEQCCMAICLLLYVRAVFGGSVRALVMWAISASVVIFTQYTGILLIASLILGTVLFRKAIVLDSKRIGIAYLFVALSFVLWMPIFVQQIHAGTPWFTKLSYIHRINVVYSEICLFMPGAPFFSVLLGDAINNAISATFVLVGSLVIFRSYVAARGRNESPNSPFPFVLSIALITMLESAATGYHPDRYYIPFASIVLVAYAGIFVNGFTFLRARFAGTAGNKILNLAVCCFAIIVLIRSMGESRKAIMQPKSGVRMLASEANALAHDPHVLWLVAPDYSASTLWYYFRDIRNFNTRLFGFAQWEHPEYYRVAGDAKAWDDEAVLDNALLHVRSAACDGFDELAFVKPFVLGKWPHDQGTLRYGKARDLAQALLQRYVVLETRSYYGREESAALIKIQLRCDLDYRRRVPL